MTNRDCVVERLYEMCDRTKKLYSQQSKMKIPQKYESYHLYKHTFKFVKALLLLSLLLEQTQSVEAQAGQSISLSAKYAAPKVSNSTEILPNPPEDVPTQNLEQNDSLNNSSPSNEQTRFFTIAEILLTTILEIFRIFATWPVIILIIVFLFQDSIKKVIIQFDDKAGRANNFKFTAAGVELSWSTTADPISEFRRDISNDNSNKAEKQEKLSLIDEIRGLDHELANTLGYILSLNDKEIYVSESEIVDSIQVVKIGLSRKMKTFQYLVSIDINDIPMKVANLLPKLARIGLIEPSDEIQNNFRLTEIGENYYDQYGKINLIEEANWELERREWRKLIPVKSVLRNGSAEEKEDMQAWMKVNQERLKQLKRRSDERKANRTHKQEQDFQ